MPIVRAAGLGGHASCLAALVAGAAVSATLSGCMGNRLSAEPAAGVSLAGSWKLDRAASDDTDKLLAQMRAQAYKIIGRHAQYQAQLAQQPTRNGRTDQQPLMDEDPLYSPGPDGHRPDPLQRSPMAQTIVATVNRGDFLTVRQSADEVVFDFGTARRSFTPGAHSVVSTENGVGDQTSGWKGGEYVIEIKGQMGPNVIETYGLSPDKHELIDTMRIGAGELPAVTLKRIYRPTTDIAPQELPRTD